MAEFEFQPVYGWADMYAMQHAVFIRGVNQDIGTNVATRKVAKVFEKRFGADKVLAVHAFMKNQEPQKLYKHLKFCMKKVAKLTKKRQNRAKTQQINQDQC